MAQTRSARLLEQLSNGEHKIAIAFSGGVDSTYLLKMALMAGLTVTPFLMVSPFVSKRELQWANSVAESLCSTLTKVAWNPFEEQRLIKNDAMRCYYCKRAMYEKLMLICRNQKIRYLYDGTQADDMISSDRPGLMAIKELGVRTPLADVGFSKQEIREQSRILRLPTWNRPSQSCIATRILRDQPITLDILAVIEMVENFLQDIGIYPVRFNIKADATELKYAQKDDELIKKLWKTIEAKVISLGFKEISLSKINLEPTF
ncbi:MAG: hypothetical protein ACUVQ6_05305 [Dissulfurimicrobium sp.]|uniref:hypothetical protein n=1 Tax=Dissulfurimicrobium sp. TaxID=2022436 RepID=UPI00404B4DD7